MTDDLERVRRPLEMHGLLLQHDTALPSVTRLLAGEPVRGSWWAHPVGHRVYSAVVALEEAAEILSVRLVAGKVTLVHRTLHGDVVAIGRERAAWQLRGLDGTAKALLGEVEQQGIIRAALSDALRGNAKKPGAVALELEKRLLVLGRSEHTASGAHAKVLESWASFAARAAVPTVAPAVARAAIEARVARWGAGTELLPWKTRRDER